ncbi:hypothetical protein BRO54_2860 [Geobacillus proteiniphilus]|uniref:Uncharacterized protein n=1 Tax=Geobacillus proteiniphilus TaxID=860353 RepID=A0A1Q5ST34_9BACL|nr:hypothetical protein BRO54_2860 [Geobacillus proteiniphilus]
MRRPPAENNQKNKAASAPKESEQREQEAAAPHQWSRTATSSQM